MVDQESVDTRYATMIATLTDTNGIEPQTTIVTSDLSDRKLEMENLNILTDNLDSEEIKMDLQNNKINSKTLDNNLKDSDMTNILGVVLNSMPTPNTNNTAVEQPNIGPCSCFICGQILNNFGERFSYLKTQKLFSMQMSLLQLLSDVVNQTVVTNTDYVDLCHSCSETMNEIDIAYKHLNDLKQNIIKLFNYNKRPKLTFHVLENNNQNNNSKPTIIKHKYNENISHINLDDLALSRPKRGRGSKKLKIARVSEIKNPIKKKGGRPRKPFQCNICKRRFITEGMVKSHMNKEHHDSANKSSIPIKPINNLVMKPKSLSKGEDKKTIILKAIEDLKVETEDDNNISASFDNELKPLLKSNFWQNLCFPLKSMSHLHTKRNSLIRPIQPKPQTLMQTAIDGSLLFLMNPTNSDVSPTLIKISKDYFNLQNENFNCELCNKNFVDDKSFRMHKIAAHGLRKKKQDESHVSYNGDQKEESIKNRPVKIWECAQCDIAFPSKLAFSEHKKTVHSRVGAVSKDHRREKMYSCEHCDEVFNYKYEHETHKETHLPFNQVGPHEFICCLCGLKVASKAALKIHLHRFHDNSQESKDYLCSECGYMTSAKKAFTDHVRIHSEVPEPKAQCHLCQKEMLRSSFKIHMLRMHGEAKYPCETCGQKFTVRSDLMKHLNTVHSSLKPYDCNLCDQKFLTAEALRYHKNKIHSMVLYFCEICGKSYKWKGELRNHTNRCHSENKSTFDCSICSKSFGDRRKLKNHLASIHKVSRDISTSPSGQKSIKLNHTKDEETIHINNIEIPSSIYEAPTNMFTTSHSIIVSSEPSTAQADGHILHPVEGEIIRTYQDSEQESITLTTLQSHISSEHEENFTQVQQLPTYHAQESHHPQTSIHHTQVNEDHNPPLSQNSENLTHVQSIYLVSDITL